LVDNLSSDSTISIAEEYCDKIITIKEFTPGKALNQGVSICSYDFVAIISGHCIPQSNTWLSELSRPFRDTLNVPNPIVGVYGRQIPERSSSPLDKRDLWNTFREEDRLQVRDVFFHNANSMIKLETLVEFPFDEEVTNVEDRVWAKQMIERGFALYYASKASVFHWHGINHESDPVRADKVVKVLEEREIYSIVEPNFRIESL
jgi:glycosyltransferase involved in cell wall biosynthesis